jgi:hypothetical protein
LAQAAALPGDDPQRKAEPSMQADPNPLLGGDPEISSASGSLKDQLQNTFSDVKQRATLVLDNAVAQVPQEMIDPVIEQIDKGPEGIRLLSIASGAVVVVVNLLRLYDGITDLSLHLDGYLLHAYQILFGLVVLALEVDPDWLGDDFHVREIVYEQARFLTNLLGRGLFYIFGAVISVVQKFGYEQLAGYLMLLVGVLHVVFYYRKGAAGTRDDFAYIRA